MTDTELLEQNPVIANQPEIKSDEEIQELITEDLRGSVNDYLVSIIGKTSTKLKNISELMKNSSLFSTTQSQTALDKKYIAIRHMSIPTIPGFTGTYKSLLQDMRSLVGLMEIDKNQIQPSIIYFHRLLSNPNLFKSNVTKGIVSSDWQDTDWTEVRSKLSRHFQTHDNKSYRKFGDCFESMNDYDHAISETKHLMSILSHSKLTHITKMIDELDATAQKCYLQYSTRPDFEISAAVRKLSAKLLRGSATAAETLAFYMHILTQVSVSYKNIDTAVKKQA